MMSLMQALANVRQPRHERSPRRLAETPGGSGDAGLAGGDERSRGKVTALN